MISWPVTVSFLGLCLCRATFHHAERRPLTTNPASLASSHARISTKPSPSSRDLHSMPPLPSSSSSFLPDGVSAGGDTPNSYSQLTKIPPPPPVSVPVWSLAAQSSSLPSFQSGEVSSSNPSAAASNSLPRTSMSIVTFATPVSADPNRPKLWVLSLYYDTLTKDSFCQSGCGVLQLLTPGHKELVNVLGKHSGYRNPALQPLNVDGASGREGVNRYNKQEECAKLGYSWVESGAWTRVGNAMGPMDLIPGCASYVLLKHLGKQMDAGDHVAVLCKVLATGRWDEDRGTVVNVDIDRPLVPLDPRSALYTGQLRDEGLL